MDPHKRQGGTPLLCKFQARVNQKDEVGLSFDRAHGFVYDRLKEIPYPPKKKKRIRSRLHDKPILEFPETLSPFRHKH